MQQLIKVEGDEESAEDAAAAARHEEFPMDDMDMHMENTNSTQLLGFLPCGPRKVRYHKRQVNVLVEQNPYYQTYCGYGLEMRVQFVLSLLS